MAHREAVIRPQRATAAALDDTNKTATGGIGRFRMGGPSLKLPASEVIVKKTRLAVAAIFLPLTYLCPAYSETRQEWIELGARVHGAFGAFIPVGIRIGLDAKERLKADPRGLSVTFYNGEKPPCPCVADGVMIATQASPGQGTLQISPERAAPGSMAVVVIRNRKTGEGLKYTISDEWLPKILSWNQSEPPTRFDAAMAAEGLFTSEPAP